MMKWKLQQHDPDENKNTITKKKYIDTYFNKPVDIPKNDWDELIVKYFLKKIKMCRVSLPFGHFRVNSQILQGAHSANSVIFTIVSEHVFT